MARTRSKACNERLEKVLMVLTNTAKPLTRAEITEKTAVTKNQLFFMFSDYQTKHLFKRHRAGRSHNYVLSATGHCATPENSFLIKQKQAVLIIKTDTQTITCLFFKLTRRRCPAYL